MTTLQQYSEQQGNKPRKSRYHRSKGVLDNPDAKEIFLKVAKEADEEMLSDTVAAQYLTDNFEIFQHLSYNTVRRYFKDYRDGRIK